MSEAKLLGGQSIIVITQEIDIAFTYSQNWSEGAALSVILMLIIGSITLWAFKKLDLDKILGRS